MTTKYFEVIYEGQPIEEQDIREVLQSLGYDCTVKEIIVADAVEVKNETKNINLN